MTEVPQDFSLEAKMQELRGILAQMQSGNLDFDTNIKLFTQGNALIKACRTYLDAAEMSVKVLVAGEEQPFEEK
jgi:exodeoxyribonuclease VII small subunit